MEANSVGTRRVTQDTGGRNEFWKLRERWNNLWEQLLGIMAIQTRCAWLAKGQRRAWKKQQAQSQKGWSEGYPQWMAVEKEKSLASFTTSSPWKGSNQWGDPCFMEHKHCIAPRGSTSAQLEHAGQLHWGQTSAAYSGLSKPNTNLCVFQSNSEDFCHQKALGNAAFVAAQATRFRTPLQQALDSTLCPTEPML